MNKLRDFLLRSRRSPASARVWSLVRRTAREARKAWIRGDETWESMAGVGRTGRGRFDAKCRPSQAWNGPITPSACVGPAAKRSLDLGTLTARQKSFRQATHNRSSATAAPVSCLDDVAGHAASWQRMMAMTMRHEFCATWNSRGLPIITAAPSPSWSLRCCIA